MKIPYALALLLGATLLSAGAAEQTHVDVSCPVVPQQERRPQMELQRQLEAQGWKVRKVTNSNHCYEVYGFDPKGQKTEAFFHPKTFERVYAESEPAAK